MGSRALETAGDGTGPPRSMRADERGFSESFAVGALVGITVLMAVTAGFYVLAVDTDEADTVTANFSYDYSSDGDALIVRYVDGKTYPADSIVVESGRNEVRWTELAGMNVDGTLEPGSVVQLSAGSDWGQPVTGVSTVRIHLEANSSRRELSNWSAR